MKAIKNFTSSMLGDVKVGDPIPDNAHGRHLESVGLAERDKPGPNKEYDTKVVEPKPRTAKKTSKKKANALDD